MEPLRTIYGDGDRFEEAVAGSLEIAIKTGDFDLQTMKASVLMMLGVLDFLKSDSPVLFIIR